MNLSLLFLCLWGSLAVLLLCVLGLLTLSWQRQAQLRAAMMQADAAAASRLRTLELQLGLVGQAVLPISTAFQAILIKELTHFHTPRVDELLHKLGPPCVLTEAEEGELLDSLRQREEEVGGQITDSEREAAHLLPLIMKRAKYEAEAFAEAPSGFRLVSIARPTIADVIQASRLHTLLAHQPPKEKA